jgi:hypothetical protein
LIFNSIAHSPAVMLMEIAEIGVLTNGEGAGVPLFNVEPYKHTI